MQAEVGGKNLEKDIALTDVQESKHDGTTTIIGTATNNGKKAAHGTHIQANGGLTRPCRANTGRVNGPTRRRSHALAAVADFHATRVIVCEAALFRVVRCAVRKYYGHDVVSTCRFRIVEFLCACPSWCFICAAVAGHLDLLGMYLLRGPNRAGGRPTAGLRYRSSTPVARYSDGCERGKERG